jgi:hypothetical protein
MHNHVIAGDFGYLPVYSDETGYTHGSEALEGLKEYVDGIIDSYYVEEMPEQYDTIEEYWLATGIVTDVGTDGCKQTIQAVFDREQAGVDYAEIIVCYEDCMRMETGLPEQV